MFKVVGIMESCFYGIYVLGYGKIDNNEIYKYMIC